MVDIIWIIIIGDRYFVGNIILGLRVFFFFYNFRSIYRPGTVQQHKDAEKRSDAACERGVVEENKSCYILVVEKKNNDVPWSPNNNS